MVLYRNTAPVNSIISTAMLTIFFILIVIKLRTVWTEYQQVKSLLFHLYFRLCEFFLQLIVFTLLRRKLIFDSESIVIPLKTVPVISSYHVLPCLPIELMS